MNFVTKQNGPNVLDISKQYLKYIILGFTIIFIGVLLFTVFDNENALFSKTYMYSFGVLVPLAIALLYFMRTNSSLQLNAAVIKSIALFVFLLSTVFYIYSNTPPSYYIYISYFINIVVFLGILIAMAIFYNIFINNLYRTEGATGVFVSILFYLPCLLSDFIGYMLQQFKITPNIVYVLFLIEIILILLYIYLPRLADKLFVSDAIVLQNEPIFLDTGKKTIATSDKLINKNELNGTNLLNTSPYFKNYCLSMWIYINPKMVASNESTNETEIFNYSYNDKTTGDETKPRITYSYKDDKHLYNIYVTNGVKHEISLPGQKWNQFVFNYNRNTVDLFINGNLTRSFDISNHLPKYDVTDQITIGSVNGSVKGIDGAICNVTYNHSPLSKHQIANSYNVLMAKNPPFVKR